MSSQRPAVEAVSHHDALTAVLDRAVTSVVALVDKYQATRSSDDEDDVSPEQTALTAEATEVFAVISTELEAVCLELQGLATEHEAGIDFICRIGAPTPAGQPTPASSPAPTATAAPA